jgi:hypothetical protein
MRENTMIYNSKPAHHCSETMDVNHELNSGKQYLYMRYTIYLLDENNNVVDKYNTNYHPGNQLKVIDSIFLCVKEESMNLMNLTKIILHYKKQHE